MAKEIENKSYLWEREKLDQIDRQYSPYSSFSESNPAKQVIPIETRFEREEILKKIDRYLNQIQRETQRRDAARDGSDFFGYFF